MVSSTAAETRLEVVSGEPQMAGAAGQLLYMTMHPLASYWMGVDNDQVTCNVLESLFAKRGNLFSHESAVMAKIGEDVVGLMIAYPATTIRKLEVRTLLQFVGVAGLRNALRLVWRSLPLESIAAVAPEEYFLAHLAVLPAYEGRGIGRRLLQASEEAAQRTGARKLTLTVDADNARAIRLYTRAGMRITSTVRFKALEKRFGYHGFHHMAKDLAHSDMKASGLEG